MSEIVVKGWRVRWIDKRGDGHQTRLYHAKTAADVFAEAAYLRDQKRRNDVEREKRMRQVTVALVGEPYVGMRFIMRHGEQISVLRNNNKECVVTRVLEKKEHHDTIAFTFSPVDDQDVTLTCWKDKCWKNSVL